MALWSGRFETPNTALFNTFTESISYDKRLYAYDIQGSLAHVKMLAAQKIIPDECAESISSALKEIKQRIEKGDFEFKAELEDIHMHIESALIAQLGDQGARVHTARSRNDQVNLDFRLYLRDEIQLIIQKIRLFQSALVLRAEEHADSIMPGFTHMQHAQVVTLGHHLLAYVEMLERDAARLTGCRIRLNRCPLGAGAIAGSTLPINREYVAEQLGFTEVTRNSMDTVADRDFVCEMMSDLAILCMHMSRLCEDLIIWMSQEFAFIELSDKYCSGSSLMPQKKNPDICELARGKTGRIYGALMSILTVCKGLPLTYNRDLQEDKDLSFDAIDTVKLMLDIFAPMLAEMKVNVQIMRKQASDPALMATDLAEQLVRMGVPFRTAHHRVGALVKYCKENTLALDKLTLEQMQSVIPEADAACLTVFDPDRSVAERSATGGTAPNQVRKQVVYWKHQLKLDEENHGN